MTKFIPKRILEIKDQLTVLFPLPEDYAIRDNEAALQVLEIIRLSGIDGFRTISDTELNWIYHISLLCSDTEFEALKHVFANRATLYSFKIGWIFFQNHPNEQRVKEIFTIACNWMKTHKPEEYKRTLPGRTGLPIDDIYMHSLDIIRAEKTNMKDFSKKHNVIFDSIFSRQLLLVYLARCDKTELAKYQDILVMLIATSDIVFLRPTLQNITFKFNFDELPPPIVEAIINRLHEATVDDNIGISPQTLLRMRKIRFGNILKNFYSESSPKQNVFNLLSCFVKGIEVLSKNFIAIDVGTYIVVDSKQWDNFCYAYQPAVYAQAESNFREQNSSEEFWLSIDKAKFPSAHDVILDIAHSSIVLLEFSSFNMLFSRDLLLSGRILQNQDF